MSDIAIKVEGLGKQYRLGEIGTGTISHDLNRWFARIRGKEDPFAKVGEANDRTVKGSSDYVWSLRDVDFEVKKGEVLGIIGRNGAGKSTLLKILSKVTAPTTGNIKVNGRIASLLEVGTGFHPELTGRENIFLNGAILGMTKTEIRSKFDEIVDFSGVERYIDTPVKRYSSGMYVRLAFAVAAFLEPEILIIDEVLAVGDAEFQKKCLGRMKDVSLNEGRTVLFVSHQLNSISTLCDRVLLMKTGMVESMGATALVIKKYLSQYSNASYTWENKNEKEYKNQYFIPTKMYLKDDSNKVVEGTIKSNSGPIVFIEGEVLKSHIGLCIGIAVYNEEGQLMFWSYQTDKGEQYWPMIRPGKLSIGFHFPKYTLNEGVYRIEMIASIHFQEWLLQPERNTPFIDIEIKGGLSESPYWQEARPGLLALQLESFVG